MTQLSSRLGRSLKAWVVVFICLSALAPLTASASENSSSTKNNAANTLTTREFCSRLAKNESNLIAKLKELQSGLNSRQLELEQTKLTSRAQHDANQLALRAQLSETQALKFERWLVRAASDAQEQALADFKASLAQSTALRQQAIDRATQNYRQAIDQAIAARKNRLTLAVATYQRAIETAVNQAKSECLGKLAPATVRQNFVARLASAQTALASERQAAERAKATLKTLATLHRAELNQATTNFKATLQQARERLKAAWPELFNTGGE